MKRAIGFEADLEAGVVTGVIAALYVVVMNAEKKTGRVEKKGASNDSPFYFYCRGKKSSANLPRNQKQP